MVSSVLKHSMEYSASLICTWNPEQIQGAWHRPNAVILILWALFWFHVHLCSCHLASPLFQPWQDRCAVLQGRNPLGGRVTRRPLVFNVYSNKETRLLPCKTAWDSHPDFTSPANARNILGTSTKFIKFIIVPELTKISSRLNEISHRPTRGYKW